MKKIKIDKPKKKKKKNYDFAEGEKYLMIVNIKQLKFILQIFSFAIIPLIVIYYIFTKFKKKDKKDNNNQKVTDTFGYINYINVAYSLDNYYHYIIHVSMKSIMLSQNSTTFINFYMLCSNITQDQKEMIDKISLQHKNCKITYIDMGNQFVEFNIPKDMFASWSTAIFYRIMLPFLLPNEKKILYLDGDTLIYKDLTKIYNYNITDKYFVGMLEFKYIGYFHDYKIPQFNNYINTGVLLFNLDEIRKGNISEKFIQFYRKYNAKIRYPVNDALNYVSHEKNGYFEPEYVVIGFCNEEDAYTYYNKVPVKINNDEVLKAYKDPYIYHFIYYAKPWNKVPSGENKTICVDPFIRFYEMARKTDYYYEILKQFEIKVEG